MNFYEFYLLIEFKKKFIILKKKKKKLNFFKFSIIKYNFFFNNLKNFFF